jgi:hypothetical protein
MPMPARTTSTFRLIGAGVTSVGALAAMLGAGGSNAQTLANLDTDPARTAHIERDCGPIAKADLDCAMRSSIAFSRARTEALRKEGAEHRKAIAKSDAAIADHQKAGEAARTRAQCLSDLSAALTAVPPRITVAEARAAKTTPTPSDDPCVWRSRLQPRLGELTKR